MKSPWFTIINKANAKTKSAEVLLYGEIGGGWYGEGVEAKAFAKEFDAIDKEADITLRIHSPGGSVFDGLAIYNIVDKRRDKVTAHVDGLAASAASFIAMAAGRVVMPKTSRLMIHDAQGFVVGDSEDMKKTADLLDRESDRIADIYAGKTGKTRSDMRALMRASTWMDGDEALASGFADEVTDKASVKNEFDLSNFRRVPTAEHGAPINNKIESMETTTAAPPAPPTPAAAQTPAVVPPPAPVVVPDLSNRLAEVEAQLAAERTARITAEATTLCAERRLEPKDWLPLALANPEMLVALAKLPKFEASAPLNLGARSENPKLTLTEQCIQARKSSGLPV